MNIIRVYVRTYSCTLNKIENIKKKWAASNFLYDRSSYTTSLCQWSTCHEKNTIFYSSHIARSRENTFDGFHRLRLRVVRARRITRRTLVKYEYNHAVSRLRFEIGENSIEKKKKKWEKLYIKSMRHRIIKLRFYT